jgi:LAS superfamily LD-carboxypeptidase LdcB
VRPSVGGNSAIRLFRSFPAVMAIVCSLIVSMPTVGQAASSGQKSSKKPVVPGKKKAPSLAALSASKAKQSQIRKQRIAASSRVSALKDEDKRVAENMQALTDDLKAQNAALGNAKRSLSQAEVEAADAKVAVADTTQAIDALAGQRQAAALEAYVHPQASRVGSMLNAKDLAEVSTGQMYLSLANRKQATALDKLKALEEDRRIALKAANKAEKRRLARRKAADERLKSLASAKARTEKYSNDVESRLERALSESDSLASIDKKLAKEIAQQQDAYAQQLAAARRNGAKLQEGGKALSVASFPLGSTNGIQVAASLRPKLAALLAAAASDGVILSGGGYRNSSQQIALRRAHCGSSNYAVYQMRASGCHPPTARPGSSQHERGLAVDFTQNGSALRRGTSGYNWMRAHANKYGFFNLPSEPWHWSTTGR